VASAFGFGSSFAGKIIYTKAKEIQALEWTGYSCPVVGSTIEVSPIKFSMPHSYFIPASLKSKTGNNLKIGQSIMGKYGGKYMISCILKYEPYTMKTVSLPTITLFGTSR